MSLAKMGSHVVGWASNVGISREHHQPVRQGCSHSTTPSVCSTPQRPQANLGGFHWLPEHGQIVGDKRAQEKESMQRGAHRRRDQSVAVHHAHETHLFDRLSGCGLSARRLRGRHRAQGCRSCGEYSRTRGLLRRAAQAREKRVHPTYLQDFRMDWSYWFLGEACAQDWQT